MKLSVIVPVYNVESYIRRCLDSLISQTYRNLEIILVDDGSTDRSGLICDEYALLDSRVQVIHKANGGITSARKAGILQATGEYTTAVDSDDWIEEEACENMVMRIEEYHPDMLVLGYKKEYTGFTEEYGNGIKDGFYQKEEFWNEFNCCVKQHAFFCQPINMALWNKAIRTEILRKYQLVSLDELRKNEDDAQVFSCLLDSNSIYVGTECFYHYCVRKSSIIWESRKEDYELFLKLAEYLILSYHNSPNKNYMDKDFLLYKMFYQIILDVPEMMFRDKRCIVYPRIRKNGSIIIYGKGVFSGRLIDCIKKMQFCNIVAIIDKTDIDNILQIDAESYDYIVIAVLNYIVAESTAKFLLESGVPEKKILCIEKENLTLDLLPEEVRDIWG